MIRTQTGVLLQYLRKLVSDPNTLRLSDRELLWRFAEHRDEAAFTTLVRRHGPMVLRLCRRLLQNDHDAEDACQATFLVLASKAASRYWHPSIATWLHRVADHVARKAKAAAVRRGIHERHAIGRPVPDPLETLTGRELQTVLDEELTRLPEKYRAPLVLCYLEGATRDEAAVQIGCPLGTLKSRLERGRELLRIRLAKRGATLSTVLSATVLMEDPLNAALSEALGERLAQGALSFTAVKTGIVGTISAPAIGLAEETLKSMALTKLKVTMALLLAASVFVGGVGAVAHRLPAVEHRTMQDKQGSKQLSKEVTRAKADAEKQGPADLYGDPLPPGALARMGTMRFRHGSPLRAALSPDGRTLATGNDWNLRLWDVASGKLLWQVRGNYNYRTRFSPDGKRLAVGGNLVDAANGRLVHRFPTSGYSPAFSPDSTLLADSSQDGTVILSHTTTGKKAGRLQGHGKRVIGLVFTQDGGKLIALYDGNRICHWNVAVSKLLKTVDLPVPSCRLEQLSPDGRTLAVNPDNREPIALWDTDTGKQRCQVEGEGASPRGGLAFSPDSRILATDLGNYPSGEVQISVWDAATGKLLRRFAIPYRAGLEDLQWAPDGRTLLSSGTESHVRLWDSVTGKSLFDHVAHDSMILSLSFAPDGKTLVSASSDGTLRVWEVATGRHLRELTAHKRDSIRATVLPDGRRVLSAGLDGRMRLQDLQTGKELCCLIPAADPEDTKGAYGGVHWPLFAVSTDGRTAASSIQTAKGNLVHVWDLATGRAVVSRTDSLGGAFPLFSPDARIVARPIPRELQIVLQDVATGKQLLSLDLGLISNSAFSPDSRTLFTITGQNLGQRDGVNLGAYTCRLWELASGKERFTVTNSEPVDERSAFLFAQKIAFAPDGRSIAISFPDGTIRVLDTAMGKERLRRSSYSRVEALAFAPDSSVLASGHADSTILVWTLAPELSQRAPVGKATAQELELWWTDLAGPNACKAHVAIWSLTAVPQQAVPLLRDRLRSATPVPTDGLRKLLTELDSNEPQRREAASQQLAELAEQAEPAVYEALSAKPSPEQRRRIEALLAGPSVVRSPEELRAVRAIEVLEQCNVPEARQVLRTLAEGTPEARITWEAKVALERLAKRTDSSR